MELVLRYIGPLAVGVNGGSSSFLAYQGGIFDDPWCKQGANHALLVTGYGQEVAHDGTTVKFWYARNSWGKGWGENGYVRVKRGHGHKGEPGVCGIARSPSVALGGILLPTKEQQIDEVEMGFALLGPQERFCGNLGLRSNRFCIRTVTWITDHKALSAGFTGTLFGLIAVVLLAGDCRKRRRRLEAARQKRKVEQERLRRSMLEQEALDLPGDIVESSPLLPGDAAPKNGSYGTAADGK